MFGAVKPPWIKPKEFKRAPYNYCDGWCERCTLTKICKVFLQGEKDKAEALKQGKDPNSWEFTMEAVGKNLAHAMVLLQEEMVKLGINSDDVEEVSEPEPNPDMLKLKQIVDNYLMRVQKILKKLEAAPIEADAKLITEQINNPRAYARGI